MEELFIIATYLLFSYFRWKSYFLQHGGIIDFLQVESGFANGYKFEQEEK